MIAGKLYIHHARNRGFGGNFEETTAIIASRQFSLLQILEVIWELRLKIKYNELK